MLEVDVAPLAIRRFEAVLDEPAVEALEQIATEGRRLLEARTVWCVNSTARGGGVAELLVPLLGYVRGAGISARWLVIDGDPEFFEVTKRLHHRLHGLPGDGGPLGPHERDVYRRTTERNAAAIGEYVDGDDIVLLHDPQVAGLAPATLATGARTVWRLHVGTDEPNDLAREAWEFLADDIAGADGYVVSRRQFAWPQMAPERTTVIAPSIDPLSPKNQAIPPDVIVSILQQIGLLGGMQPVAPEFRTTDGAVLRVQRTASILQEAPIPRDCPVVTQVSRWDPLKDPLGVLDGFVQCAEDLGDAHLVLAGPDVSAVADDPEAEQMLSIVHGRWHALPDEVRGRVHLASLPMDDVTENAAMVNALQRYSMVIVQKSLAEGFGLTVAEAMWKERPVIGGGVGGILDQIVDGESGILLEDPSDLAAFGDALRRLLGDPALAREMGAAARQRVLEHYLEPRHLADWLEITRMLLRVHQP